MLLNLSGNLNYFMNGIYYLPAFPETTYEVAHYLFPSTTKGYSGLKEESSAVSLCRSSNLVFFQSAENMALFSMLYIRRTQLEVGIFSATTMLMISGGIYQRLRALIFFKLLYAQCNSSRVQNGKLNTTITRKYHFSMC